MRGIGGDPFLKARIVGLGNFSERKAVEFSDNCQLTPYFLDLLGNLP